MASTNPVAFGVLSAATSAAGFIFSPEFIHGRPHSARRGRSCIASAA